MKMYTKIVSIACLTLFLTTSVSGEEYQTEALNSPDRTVPVFFEALREKMPFALGWKDGISDPAQWQKAGLAKAVEIMIPFQDTTAFEMTVLDEIDRGSYLAQKVIFNLTAESRVLALLLIPKGEGPFPAALMLHDHGGKFDIGKEKMVETWNDDARLESSIAWSKKYFTETFPGDELAKRGYVVLSFDALGWGHRSVAGYRGDSQQALAANLLNLGVSYAGLIAMEDVRAAKFLAQLPEVDTERVAAVGFSMGAFRAWQVAALSEDITAAIVENWMATMKGLMVIGNNQLKGQSAFTMLHPFIARYLDYPDVAGLAAPKPILFHAGEEDPLFPLESAKEAFSKMEGIWKSFGAEENLTVRIWPYGHVFYKEQQDAAYDWLDGHFKGKE